MRDGREFTRRTLIHFSLGSLFVRRLLAESQSPAPDPVKTAHQSFSTIGAAQRRYRVDATILLCGVPILSRHGVGGGFAGVESGRTPGATAQALQFVAGSWPEKAHGLNRFGILQEAVVERAGGATELAFAGLITSSHEENLDQARSGLIASRADAEATMIRGATRGGCIQTWLDKFSIPSTTAWTSLHETLSQALCRKPQTQPRENAAGTFGGFLFAMRRAALDDAAHRAQFLHGINRDADGIKRAEFQATYDPKDTSGIPVSIDYRARSFLRLVFVAKPDTETIHTTIPSLFAKEVA
jgi:hypothetical protein